MVIFPYNIRNLLVAMALWLFMATVTTSQALASEDLYSCDPSLRAITIVADRTSERTDVEKSDANAILETVKDYARPGQPVYVFVDDGLGYVTRTAGPLCRVRRCPDGLFAAFLDSYGRNCRRQIVAEKNEVFDSEISAGLAPYHAPGDARESRIFGAIADIDQHLQRDGFQGALVIYLGDAIPNNHDIARYAPGAAWLRDTPQRDTLFDQLKTRGFLPNLGLYEIHFVGVGRPHNSARRTNGHWHSPKAVQELSGFWEAFRGVTGALIYLHPRFDAGAIFGVRQ